MKQRLVFVVALNAVATMVNAGPKEDVAATVSAWADGMNSHKQAACGCSL